MSHVYVIGQCDTGENDSCDSPIEPNSPVHGASGNSDESLHGDVNVANTTWGAIRVRSWNKALPAQVQRGHGRSILDGHKDSPRDSGSEMTISRSAGASPIGSRRRRGRSSCTIIPGDDIVRVVRAINDTLKRNNPSREVDEHSTSPDRQENASPSHIHRRQTSCPKAISLPSSLHKYRSRDHDSERNEAEKLEEKILR